MGYKLSFMDNEVYSAQDVNEHFSKLFSGGVSLVESGNILADLNGLTSQITDYGVLYDACLVVKTQTGYKISAGSAFMHDGSQITFDADGYAFSASSGKYWYVYLQRNAPENRIDIKVTESAPPENCVLLANISAGGEVYDKREYAKLKVNTDQANTLRRFKYTAFATEDYAKKSFDMGNAGFTYFAILKAGGLNMQGYLPINTNKNNLLEIADGVKLEIPLYDNGGVRQCYIHVTRTGNTIEVQAFDDSFVNSYEFQFGVI